MGQLTFVNVEIARRQNLSRWVWGGQNEILSTSGTKYIRLLYFNFSYQVYNILFKKYGGFMTQVLEKVLNSPIFLKSEL